MGFLASAITVYFNAFLSNPIFGSPEWDWPETIFEALLTSTRPPPWYFTRANPTNIPIAGFIFLVYLSTVPSTYMIEKLGWTSFSLIYSPFVATRLFIKHADPFMVYFTALWYGMSLGHTLDFLFAFYNKNHIVLCSAFNILLSALLSRIKPYCRMAAVTLLALFSVGVYLQRRKQTNPAETNNGDVPSERIPATNGEASTVSSVEKTAPAATLPFSTNSEVISQRTNLDYEGAQASFLTFLLPCLQAVYVIRPIVLSSYTADVAQDFHNEMDIRSEIEASATQLVADKPLNNLIQKSIVPSCRRYLSRHRQTSEHIAINIEWSQDDNLLDTSPTPSGSPSFLELTDSPSLVTDPEQAHTATTNKTPVFLDHCV